MMSQLLAARLKIPATVLSQSLADEMVLLHMDSATYFGLNPLGARIWQLLRAERGRSLKEIRQLLQLEYDVEEAELTRDLLRFTQSLSEHGLIEVA